MVGLGDPNAAPARVSALHPQLRLGFTHLPVAHVKSENVAAVPRRKATHAGGGVHQAAAFPLTDVDLKRPESALIKNKSADLIVLVEPGRTKLILVIFYYLFLLKNTINIIITPFSLHQQHHYSYEVEVPAIKSYDVRISEGVTIG